MSLNEWGIPCWRNAERYGDTTTWPVNRWEWEFLRRRPDLRSEFDDLSGERHQQIKRLHAWDSSLSPGGVPHPSDRGFWVSSRILGAILPNPRIGDQPPHVLPHNSNLSFVQQFSSEKPPDGFCRIDFDLGQPLAPQIEAAKMALIEMQIAKTGKPLQKRRHPAKWLEFLRVLDAREDHASWSEISRAVLNKPNSPQSARDAHKQALALCFNF